MSKADAKSRPIKVGINKGSAPEPYLPEPGILWDSSGKFLRNRRIVSWRRTENLRSGIPNLMNIAFHAGTGGLHSAEN
jgi:hypothetical protein